MNPKRIKWIIGLITSALVGIVCLQVYWISRAVRLNEDQFDKNVIEALNRVSDKLEYWESMALYDDAGKTPLGAAEPFAPANGYDNRSKRKQNAAGLRPINTDISRWELLKVSQMAENRSLAERIRLDILGQTLQEEINNKGIQTPFQYGVFDKSKSSFVIMNGYYVVPEPGSAVVKGRGESLYDSPYRVALFQQDMESPGYLVLYFPKRTRLLWGALWPVLLLSIVFTGIILFSFWYTIQVIFRQKKLSEMKNDFINNMTHEFKTPIATISLAADSIAMDSIIRDPDKIRRFLDIIRQENRRMNNQVERVLQMAQISKSELQMSLAQVNVHELIRHVMDNFSLQVEQRNGVLRAKLDALNPIIEGDATHLSGILHNLLDNANKYSPDNPDIAIHTRNTASGVEIAIQDRGIGIGKEARKHIFDRFYRVHTGNVHNVKGFGLGLSYVRDIVDAHRGDIEVKSELGKGSTFIVRLPFKQR